MTKSEYIRHLEQMRHDLIKSGDMLPGSLLDVGFDDWIEEVYTMSAEEYRLFIQDNKGMNECGL